MSKITDMPISGKIPANYIGFCQLLGHEKIIYIRMKLTYKLYVSINL